MRPFLIALSVLALAGCSIVYRLPTRQGNLIEQKQFDQLKVGQTREQVHYLLGTPIASSAFSTNRWTYFGYYKDPRGNVATRTISLYFDGDKLARTEGVEVAVAGKPVESEEVERIVREQKNDNAELPQNAGPKATAPPIGGIVPRPNSGG
jgi:outer membrane protein assembly factor BamE (lipoprotein component of BamABCDE complex)